MFNNLFGSLQAKIILAIGALLLFLHSKQLNSMKLTIAVLSILINAFAVNCLVNGQCHIYSWLVVVANLFALNAILSGDKLF